MPNEIVSQKRINWTGLAACITAIGGLLGLYWNQNSNDTKQTLTSKSMYEVMEYRLSLVEQVCGVPTPASAGAYRNTRPPRHPIRVTKPSTPAPEKAPLRDAIRKHRKHRATPASFQALQQYIETTGSSWVPDEGDDGNSDHP